MLRLLPSRLSGSMLTRVRNLSTITVSHIEDKLKESLKISSIHVEDISGGCGAMFQVGVDERNRRKDSEKDR